MSRERVDHVRAPAFVCSGCRHRGARVERLAISGTAISRLLKLQAHRYAFVSIHGWATPKCTTCGYWKAGTMW
jgi:predicted nucleic-acid-binding Zn-ribbon protein